jgi:hypothetical protein
VLREFLTSRNLRREHWQGGTEAASFCLSRPVASLPSAAERYNRRRNSRSRRAKISSRLRTSPSITQNSNIIGRNVARFRYQKGWSQNLLVTKMQLLGIYITRDIVANIETLRTSVTDKQIVIFAEVFNMPVGDLFPPKQKSSRRVVGLTR